MIALTERTRKRTEFKIVILLFVLYMGGLLKILLFRDSSFTSSRTVNLIPFGTIAEYVGMTVQSYSGFKEFICNIIGNILIMVPFGYFLPIIWRRFNRIMKVTLAAGVFSVMIEVLQYIWKVGSSDIDDIILNTLGGFIGFLLYQWISERKPLRIRGYIQVIGLSVIMLSGGAFIAFKDYSAVLGI